MEPHLHFNYRTYEVEDVQLSNHMVINDIINNHIRMVTVGSIKWLNVTACDQDRNNK
jgi:hypothetical protein